MCLRLGREREPLLELLLGSAAGIALGLLAGRAVDAPWRRLTGPARQRRKRRDEEKSLAEREAESPPPPAGETPEKPREESPTPHASRIYVNNQDQLCLWGHKPRVMEKTWLGSDHASGYYNFTPYSFEEVVRGLKMDNAKVDVSPQAANRAKRARIVREAAERVHNGLAPLPESNLASGELRDYQRKTLAFADATQGRFLLADDMGLGKTVQAIAAARHLECDRVLIITKASVKYKWRREVLMFDGCASRDVRVLEGTDAESVPKSARWVVANYDILEEWLEDVLAWAPDMVIVDEAHWVSNPEAKRSMAVKTLALEAPFCVALTGTPIRNRPRDLWNILDMLQPGWWGRKYDYEWAFCGGKKRPVWRRGKGGRKFMTMVWKADGVSNEPVFNERLRGVMLRRLKGEVEKSLPERTRTAHPVKLEPAAQSRYAGLQEELRAAFERKDYQKVLNVIMGLRQASSMGRVGATVEKALEVAREQERPVVVFAYFLDAMDEIEKLLKAEKLRVARIDGSTPASKRGDIEEQFQAGKLDAVVGQVQACGEGINLFRSDVTLHHDVTWTPFEQDQAESRVHRIGQTKPTTHLYFLGEGTIDERILDLTLKKLQMSRSILDTGQKIDDDVLRELKLEHFRPADKE